MKIMQPWWTIVLGIACSVQADQANSMASDILRSMLEPRFRSLESMNEALEQEANGLREQLLALQQRNRRLRSLLAKFTRIDQLLDSNRRHLQGASMSQFATLKSVKVFEVSFENVTSGIEARLNQTNAAVATLSVSVGDLADAISDLLPLSFCGSLTSHGTHLYQYVAVPATYDGAKIVARALPQCCNQTAHLVTIGDGAENSFVQSLFLSLGWLGLSDQATEGEFKWVTGESLSYTNWASGQPDNFLNEDCVQMQLLSGKWQDMSCLLGLAPFVVEYDCA